MTAKVGQEYQYKIGPNRSLGDLSARMEGDNQVGGCFDIEKPKFALVRGPSCTYGASSQSEPRSSSMRTRLLLWLMLVSFAGMHSADAKGPVVKATILAGRSNMGGQQLPDSEPATPVSRTVRNIEGWTVREDDRLLEPPNEAIGAQALRFLEARLADIKAVMAADPLKKLQGVAIVLDLSHGKLRTMQYHPSPEWLRDNGYSIDLAKCVHIPVAADLATPRNINQQPWVVLHELAHAYYDQVLGFEEPRILKAYEDFKRNGHGEATLLYDGTRTRHYALTDHKEFFAEMTEAYFGLNDFFPFNRAELMTAEPEIFDLMQTISGPVAGVQTKSVKAAGSPALPTAPGARVPLPDFRTLAEGPQQVRLLPGQHEFVFRMYGAPGDLETLRQLVGVMRERRIGNGFDPGPGTGPAPSLFSTTSPRWAGRSSLIPAAKCRSKADAPCWAPRIWRRWRPWIGWGCSPPCNWANGATTSTTWLPMSPGGARFLAGTSMRSST